MTTRLNSTSAQNKFYWLLLAALVFIPRLLNLDVFLTPDEPLFLEHARQFAHGMATGNFNQTLGIGYPGVTIALAAAPVVNLPSTELGAYVAGRLAVGLLTGLLTLLLCGLGQKLLGRWPAFIGVALLALDPYMLGYSRLLHNEATLALTMTLAGVSWLLWLRAEQRRWLALAGLFTGLALLTKSTALLLGPLLATATLGWAIAVGRWRVGRWWGRVLLGGGAALLAAAAVFVALWPAMWVDPVGAVSLTLGKLLRDQEAGTGNLGMFWLGRFVDDPGPLFYPVAFLLKATPWLLIGLLLAVGLALFRPINRETVGLWALALVYLLLMTIASKKSVRYMLPAWPALYLLAGWGWAQLGQLANRRWAAFVTRHSSFAIRYSPFATLIVVAAFALAYHPYYFSYYNPAVGGWRWAPNTLLVGWGEGLDLAAGYLNQKPAATVAAWYDFLFPLYYHGQTRPVTPPENLLTADHAVVYISQVQRNIPNPNIIDYFRNRRQPEYTARLNGIDYAWVYPGPVAGFAAPSSPPQFALGGDFGGELRLLGYSLTLPPVAGEPALVVTLQWQVVTPPPTERFVFVRLIDGQGQIWAKTDSPPVMGLWPVARWQPGMFIADAQKITLPAAAAPDSLAQYRLEVGVYNPATGQPVPATGQPLGAGGGLLLGAAAPVSQPGAEN